MLRAIAVDDEKRSRTRLSRIIKAIDGIILVKSFSNGDDALEYLVNNKVDIALLDIEMPVMNGIELGDHILHNYENIELIYITAYDQYAIDAFNIYAIGYLLKPIDADCLQKHIEHILKKRTSHDQLIREVVLSIDVLGTVRCYIDGDTKDLSFRTKKAEELFLFLIHNQGNLVSRNDITDTIWPYMEIKKAVTNFHSTCYYIRETLKLLGCGGLLIKERGQYKIDTLKIRCDAIEFSNLFDEMNKSEFNLKDSEQLFKIYKGLYFENKAYDWISVNQCWFENAYEKLLNKMEDMYFNQSLYERSFEMSKKIINHNPLEDKAYVKLIKYCVKNQEYLQAIKFYKEYKRVLKKELGINPAEEVKKLVEDYLFIK
jgi:two-component SAPR family response regulator